MDYELRAAVANALPSAGQLDGLWHVQVLGSNRLEK